MIFFPITFILFFYTLLSFLCLGPLIIPNIISEPTAQVGMFDMTASQRKEKKQTENTALNSQKF